MFLFEQNVDPGMFNQQPQSVDDNDGQDAAEQELTPVKKFIVIQRLQDLRSKLERYSINDSDLDIILKFADYLSYETLYNLSLILVDKIDQKIQEINQTRM